MANAVDVSNYTKELTQSVLAKWQADGIQRVIVQAVDPPPGYPHGVTRQQLQACLDAGMETEAYIYVWFGLANSVADLQRKLSLLEGYSIKRLWLDVEDDSPPAQSPAQRVYELRQLLDVADAWAALHGLGRTGIYTGSWYWSDYMGNTTEFSDRPLWAAQYDHQQNLVVAPFGGWTSVVIKQYAGTSVFDGQGGIDLDVEDLAEVAVQIPQTYQDKFHIGPEDVEGLIANFEGIIDSLQPDVQLAQRVRQLVTG